MEQFNEIVSVSKWLKEMLQDKLYPVLLTEREEVQIIVPAEKEVDYKVGIWLYDIQDYSDYISKEYQMINNMYRRFPPKAVELFFMITILEEKQFGGIIKEDSQRILSAIISFIYDHPIINIESSEIMLRFSKLSMDMKIKLWSSISKPMQTAVYIHTAPILVKSERIEEYHLVKKEPEVDIKDKNK